MSFFCFWSFLLDVLEVIKCFLFEKNVVFFFLLIFSFSYYTVYTQYPLSGTRHSTLNTHMFSPVVSSA